MDTLFSLIQRIKTCFGVQICVHDVSGVTYSRASLNMPYLWLQHGSAYCSVAKKCVSEKRCMRQKQVVMWKLRKNGGNPFYGVCYMGVCEYILPVERNGRLLAVVFASGLTAEDEAESREKLERAAQRMPQERSKEAAAGYRVFASESAVSREKLRFFAELIREKILSSSVGVSVAGSNAGDPYAVESVRERQGQSGMVRAILGYIEASLPGPITLADLNAAFFMSEGHLSRIFRKEMGMSIMAYVKRMRIQTAARLLLDSSEPVGVIAARVGIVDANYFCRMFKSVMGMSPSEYRIEQTIWTEKGQNRH